MNQTNFSKNTQKACQAIITLFLVITLNSYVFFNDVLITTQLTSGNFNEGLTLFSIVKL